METLTKRKIDFVNTIEDFLLGLAGPEFFMSCKTDEHGTFEIKLAFPKECICIKDDE